MIKNKHVITAMIVAPILSVLAWIGVGQLAGERPAKAIPGNSYPLVEKSNCRYASGACDLENEDFSLRLTLQQSEAGPRMLLTSAYPLEGVVLSVGPTDQKPAPASMQVSGQDGVMWQLPLAAVPGLEDRIRLVASAGGSTYFGEASTKFIEKEVK